MTIFLVRKRCVMDTKAVWSIAELHICNFTIIFSEIYKFRNRGYSILKVKQQKMTIILPLTNFLYTSSICCGHLIDISDLCSLYLVQVPCLCIL